MGLPNPIYIDEAAIHRASQIRTLVYAATEGREGVFNATHLAIKAQGAPDDTIFALPGAYVINAKHLGGDFESYIGKIQTAETSLPISNVSSSGPRTDLVILRIENPYVTGSGVWASPSDEQEGPYAHVRVIENVTPNINHVVAWNSTWTAIPLARITRPANTTIVQQSHIVDLRSIARIGEERLTIIENPPYDPPPIAQQYWTESTPCDQGDQHLKTQMTFHNFPNEASWSVAVPNWALGFDIQLVYNPQVDGSVWGDHRIVVNNTVAGIVNDDCGIVPTMYDVNLSWLTQLTTPGPIRDTMMIGGTGILASAHRGKVVNFRMQAKSRDSSVHPGKLAAANGTRVNVFINFKRYPVISDG